MKENSLTDEASDGELLSAMAADDDSSYSAFDIFYNRYFDDLLSFTFRVFGLLEADRFDLVQDTMLQAFRAAATFKKTTTEMRKECAAGQSRGSAKLRPISTAKNTAVKRELNLNHWKKENQEMENVEIPSEKITDAELVWKIRESEDKIFRDISTNGHSVSLPRKIMREVLAELTEREQEILLATYEEFDFQKPNQHLSQEKIDELTERYSISSKNLKQIRYRARKFVFEESLKRFEASRTEIKI